MTTTTKPRWVTILDGFVAVHGTNLAWVCKRIGLDHASLSKARAGEPGRHVTEPHQKAIADLFQVPPRIIFGPWDHWPYDWAGGRLGVIVGEGAHGIESFKARLRPVLGTRAGLLHDPLGSWLPEVRAVASRLLWVPESAIWHDDNPA